jgi:hypothetical protein
MPTALLPVHERGEGAGGMKLENVCSPELGVSFQEVVHSILTGRNTLK